MVLAGKTIDMYLTLYSSFFNRHPLLLNKLTACISSLLATQWEWFYKAIQFDLYRPVNQFTQSVSVHWKFQCVCDCQCVCKLKASCFVFCTSRPWSGASETIDLYSVIMTHCCSLLHFSTIIPFSWISWPCVFPHLCSPQWHTVLILVKLTFTSEPRQYNDIAKHSSGNLGKKPFYTFKVHLTNL